MATLYRNFPNRQQLLEALYADEVNAICEAAATVESETPGAALTAWLHRFFAFYNSKRHVGDELLRQTDARAIFLHEGRGELTLEQILDMVIAIAKIDGDAPYLQPILQAALDGLRPPNNAKPVPDSRRHRDRRRASDRLPAAQRTSRTSPLSATRAPVVVVVAIRVPRRA